jgi:hypothetical protein
MLCTRRHRSCLSWSLWILFLGLTAAVACASHPPSHDHDVGHPPLCTDTSSAAMLAPDKSALFPDGGTFPLSLKSLFPMVSLAALSGQLPAGLFTWPGDPSQIDTRTSVSPPMFLVVLRQ